MPRERLATIVPLPSPDADYRVLVDVLRELSRGVDLASTFQAASTGLSRLTAFDWFAISWCPPRGDGTRLHASLSGRPDWLANTVELGDLHPAVAAWLLPEIPRMVTDARGAAACEAPTWPVPADVRPLISVPMPSNAGGSRAGGAREQRRGAILLGRSGDRAFDPGLVALLEPCAAHLAVLLEKAEWLERFRRANAELREQVNKLRARRGSLGEATIPSMRVPAGMRRGDPAEGPRWIAVDAPGLEALEIVERAAETDVGVVLHGESGTGKELMARTLHRLSARRRQPFVAVNVASLTPELVGSELFGHAEGAFTGAQGTRRGLVEDAGGGTLFLDEIGDMPPAVQPALLRFLEDGGIRSVGGNEVRHVDTRIVCATNRDLEADVAAGRFREDLYHRLAGIVVVLPPLRERPGDLRLLARQFIKVASDGRWTDLPASWWPAFAAWPWPGNVRELHNAVRSVATMSRGELEARFLPRGLREAVDAPVTLKAEPVQGPDPYDGWTLTEVEREMIRLAMQATCGHRGRAAQRLGITPRALYDKIRRLGLA